MKRSVGCTTATGAGGRPAQPASARRRKDVSKNGQVVSEENIREVCVGMRSIDRGYQNIARARQSVRRSYFRLRAIWALIAARFAASGAALPQPITPTDQLLSDCSSVTW